MVCGGRAVASAAWLLWSKGILIATGSDQCHGNPSTECVGLATEDVALLATGLTMKLARSRASSSDVRGHLKLDDTLEHEKGVLQELVATSLTGGGPSASLLEGLSKIRVTPQVQEYIIETLKSLERIFSNIQEASDNDTSLRDSIYNGFETIATQYQQSMDAATGKVQHADSVRQDHKACRTQESPLFDSKVDSEQHVSISLSTKSDKSATANEKHDALLQGLQSAANIDYDALSLSALANLKRLAKEYHDAVSSYTEAIQAHMTETEELGNITEKYTQKKAACDEEQANFEAACL